MFVGCRATEMRCSLGFTRPEIGQLFFERSLALAVGIEHLLRQIVLPE